MFQGTLGYSTCHHALSIQDVPFVHCCHQPWFGDKDKAIKDMEDDVAECTLVVAFILILEFGMINVRNYVKKAMAVSYAFLWSLYIALSSALHAAIVPVGTLGYRTCHHALSV